MQLNRRSNAYDALKEIIGEHLDTPAREALLREAGGDVHAAIDNLFNQLGPGQQAPTWEPTVGGACEARFRGGGQLPSYLLPKDCWYKGIVDAAHDDGTYAVRYDDGDFEEVVKRRDLRRPNSLPQRPAKRTRQARPDGGAAAALHDVLPNSIHH